MVVYLSIKISQPDVMDQSATRGLNTAQAVWYTFGIVRAYRWVRQQHVVVGLSLSWCICGTERAFEWLGQPVCNVFCGVHVCCLV